MAVLHERGYHATGVRHVMERAGAPLGSFSNHFRSKEEFAALVLDRYFARLTEMVDVTLRDERLQPLQRIDAYFRLIDEVARPFDWSIGCMVANFGLEMPSASEVIRSRLIAALEALTAPFEKALRDGQACGDVRADADAADLAMVVLSGWHGAILRAKVNRSGDPLQRFWSTMRPLLASPADV